MRASQAVRVIAGTDTTPYVGEVGIVIEVTPWGAWVNVPEVDYAVGFYPSELVTLD